MGKNALPAWLIGLAIIVALPTIGCACYYTFLDFGEGGTVAVPVVLAYPALLIAAIGLGNQLLSPRRTRTKLLAWAMVLAITSAMLVIAHR
jgi:hypothetical protein